MTRKYTRRRPYTRLGGGGVPSSKYRAGIARAGGGVAGVDRPSTRYTRGGPAGSTGFMPGDFTGRDVIITPNSVVVTNTITNTHTANPATIKQANIIRVTGLRFIPRLNPATIIQAGTLVRVTNTIDRQLNTRVATITQIDPSTNYIRVENVAQGTLTTNTAQILKHNIVSVTNRMGSTLVTRSANILPGVLGESFLSQADIVKIWNGIKIDGYSPMEILRYMAAVLGGKVTGAGTGTETFLSIDPNNQVPRVVSKTDSNGNRTSVELL